MLIFYCYIDLRFYTFDETPPYTMKPRIIIHQGRTQEGADGAKPLPLPEIPGKLFTYSNPEHFMFRSLFILLQIMFPRFN